MLRVACLGALKARLLSYIFLIKANAKRDDALLIHNETFD
ncbi:MAG: hypothetical protein JWM68_392 [Verrucomicrobiales bacterium]|nr:hypothetical protein [Verrucomicrobiales bacterium]